MNIFSTASGLLAGCVLCFAYKVWKLDPDRNLNRLMMGMSITIAVYELASSILFTVNAPQIFPTVAMVASLSYIIIGVFNAAVQFTYAVLGKRLFWVLISVVGTLSVIELGEIMTGHWLVKGFHPSPFGTVTEWDSSPLPNNIHTLTSAVSSATTSFSLIVALVRFKSKRYRQMTIIILIFGLGLSLLDYFCVRILWLTLGLPNCSCILAGMGLIIYVLLIRQYRFLSENQPDLSELLESIIRGSYLLTNVRDLVVHAPIKITKLWEHPLIGEPIVKVLSDCPKIAEHWRMVKEHHQPRQNIPLVLQAEKFRVTIYPHLNPFGEFDGALVHIFPEKAYADLVTTFGLTAREKEIVDLICDGLETAEIAETLNISQATVRTHLHNLYEKTGTSGRQDVLRIFLSAYG